ncbi:hypothetical protein [Cellulomonas soli]|uniref:Uncharacterized protein n=1 Tax=Cellulomonas soli TaxID=931535 RepID=A0A512P9E4_9CELL|nr:hypothetical protein [Cellulomonas soli]NYI60300.1 hypothetical protein [Cellulomonas soli]GEP67810.1 hypothetical protein CSO01_05250 [Cellulomonas soli]
MDLKSASVAELLRLSASTLEVPPRCPTDWDARAELVSTISYALEDRGLDGESIIRFGLAHLFGAPILGTVAVALLVESHAPLLDGVEEVLDVAQWRRSMGLEGRTHELSEALGHASYLLNGWIAFAPLGELLRMEPPDRDRLDTWASAVDESTRASTDTYRWAVRRLLEPGLDEWDTTSLKMEYRYSVMAQGPNLPSQLLESVAIDSDRLAHALARKALTDDDERQEASWTSVRSGVLKQAKMLLGQGRCSEAAALFEFLISRAPADAWLRNNFAFCLITTRPSDAYALLREAQRLGFEPTALLLYNRACCATSETQKREVIFEANRHWLESLESVPVPAYVWRRSGSAFEGAETSDVRQELAAVASELALELGELHRAEIWRARLASVNAG